MHAITILCSLVLVLSISSVAVAEINPIPERDAAIGLEGSSPLGGGASGACTIAYYNWCSGWTWFWSGWSAGEKVGIVYDLAVDCLGGDDHTCTNIGNWWYWRSTDNGYGGGHISASYALYDVDADNCLSGAPIGSFGSHYPVERWNYVPGMGSTSSDRVALVGEWAFGFRPWAVTDNNVKNASGGPVNLIAISLWNCASTTATETSSWTDLKQLFQ